MGLFDSLKKGAKYKLKEREIYKKIEEKEREAEEKIAEKYEETLKELLSRFKMDQLQRICEKLDIPNYEVVEVNGEEREYKIKSKKRLIEVMIEDVLDRELFDDVIEFARKFKVPYKDLTRELERFEEEIEREVDEYAEKMLKELEEFKKQLYGDEAVKEMEEDRKKEKEAKRKARKREIPKEIWDIIREFEPVQLRNEEDLEKQFFQFARGRLGKDRVQRQVPTPSGVIDIVIDDKIGIEFKIAERKQKMQRLLGQVDEYLDFFDHVIAVVLDVGANINLDYYERKLKEKGAEVYYLKGAVRRVGKKQEIVITLRR